MIFHLITAYLIGAIPFGLLLTKLAGLGDIRQIGSGNIGATNVLRTGNKKLAALTLLLDGAKGALAVLLFSHYAAWAGLAVVLGHIFPLWLKFKGGKGVATAFGVMLAWSWPLGLALLAIWLFMAWSFRYSSLAALTSMAAAPILFFVAGQADFALYALGLCLIIAFTHRDNIKRLWDGTESKIGESTKENDHAAAAPPS